MWIVILGIAAPSHQRAVSLSEVSTPLHHLFAAAFLRHHRVVAVLGRELACSCSLSLLHTDRKFIGSMLSEAHTLVSELGCKNTQQDGGCFCISSESFKDKLHCDSPLVKFYHQKSISWIFSMALGVLFFSFPLLPGKLEQPHPSSQINSLSECTQSIPALLLWLVFPGFPPGTLLSGSRVTSCLCYIVDPVSLAVWLLPTVNGEMGHGFLVWRLWSIDPKSWDTRARAHVTNSPNGMGKLCFMKFTVW